MAENSPAKSRSSVMYHPYGKAKPSPTKHVSTSRPLTLATMNEGNYLSFSGGSSSLFPCSNTNRLAMSEVSNLLKKNLIKNPLPVAARKQEPSTKQGQEVGVIGGHRQQKKPPPLGFIPIENSFEIVGISEGKESIGRVPSFTLTSKPQVEGENQKKIQPFHWPALKHKGIPIAGKSFFAPTGTSFSIYEDEDEISVLSKDVSSNMNQSFAGTIDSMDISYEKAHLSYRAPLHDISFRSDVSILSDSGVSAMSEAEASGFDDSDINSNAENLNTSINLSLSTTRKDLARMTVPTSPLLFEDNEIENQAQEDIISASVKQIPSSNFLPPSIANMFAPKCNDGKLDFSIPGGVLSERKNPIYDFPEYCLDILNYWLAYEKRSRPKRSYMSKQQEISHRMRTILVDWIVEVGMEYAMHGETIFLAVSCVDRFLSKMGVARNKLQLIGTVALFICAKYEEIQPPDISDFVYITDETYTKQQVLQMEIIMLNILSYDLMTPTSYDFVRSFSSILRLDCQTTCLAIYMTELAMMDGERYLGYLPSIVATAAVALARYTFQGLFWDEKITILTTHRLRDIQRCSQHLFNSFYDAPTSAQTAVYEKYKSVRYCSISLSILPAKLPWV